MAITFKELENFLVCAHSRSLSEAAEKLDIAQPSLSLAIKKLETELKENLFIRTREGIRLSPSGKLILPEVEEILNGLNKLQGKKILRRFKIGCHPSVGISILGEFLRKIHTIRPDIEFEIINATSHETNKSVANGEIDFGIVMNPIKFQGLIEKTIGQDIFGVWESPKRYQDRVIYSPLLMQSHSILSRWDKSPTNYMEVQNLELIAKLVDEGAGFGIIPRQVVRSQSLNLKQVKNAPSFSDRLAIVCYPEIIRTAEGKLIFDYLRFLKG